MSRIYAMGLWFGAVVLGAGCNGGSNLIDHVSFQPSTDNQTVQVSLVFSNSIQSNLSDNMVVSSYGFLFVAPYAPSEPFQVGFTLQTEVFNDPDFAKLRTTQLLPNGLPTGIDHGMVEIEDPNPINSQFNLYGYVDVASHEWLGTVAIFDFINSQYFPNGLSVSEVFLRDGKGSPGVIASVFGPTVNSAGTMTRAGGIAVFANVKGLLANHAVGTGASALTLRPVQSPIVSGPRAREFQGNEAKLRRLESELIQAFNRQ